MKFTKALFLTLFFIGIGALHAQKEMECKTKLSLFHQDVKMKNYDKAYANWKYVKDSCPDLSAAIYIDGEKILKHKISKTQGTEQKAFLTMLLDVWTKRGVYFPAKTPKGTYLAKQFQLMYDYNKVFEKSKTELYEGFDTAFKSDRKTFTNPKSLYTYFSLVAELQDEGKKTLKEVFNKYDEINEKIEEEVTNYSKKLNALVEKEAEAEAVPKKKNPYKASYESYLKQYNIIKASIVKKLDDRADCVNLIPFYTKDFEAHKTDAIWLKRAVSKMYYKECTEDPLYEKLVVAYDNAAPSADTKFFVAYLMMKNGNTQDAEKYLAEAYELETDAFKKAKLAYKIGLILKKRGSFSKARGYFRKALKLNPSDGRPHLAIAAMYAKSANDCGDNEFNKRAVYWLAAKEAKKATRVDPTAIQDAQRMVKRYEALAPSKQMIFICGCSGKEIKIQCWIHDTVIVPEIKKN